jgi:hypothetical protein
MFLLIIFIITHEIINANYIEGENGVLFYPQMYSVASSKANCSYRDPLIENICSNIEESGIIDPSYNDSWIDKLININMIEIDDVLEELKIIVEHTSRCDGLINFHNIENTVQLLVGMLSIVENNIDCDINKLITIVKSYMNAFNNLIFQFDGWNNATGNKGTEIAAKILFYIQYTAFILGRNSVRDPIENENIITSISFMDTDLIEFKANGSSIIVPRDIINDNVSNFSVGSLIKRLDNYLMNGINESQVINTKIISISIANSNKTILLEENKKVRIM